MKKLIFIISLFCLLSLSSFAQTPNFSGEWSLDKGKSKMDERQAASIESQTMKVEQTGKEVKVAITTKQAENQVGRRTDIGGGTNIYALDGKELNSENDSQIGKVFVRSKGEILNGKLNLQLIRTINNPMGEIVITTKEIWDLSDDGKTLTIKREFESQRGKIISDLSFTKKG